MKNTSNTKNTNPSIIMELEPHPDLTLAQIADEISAEMLREQRTALTAGIKTPVVARNEERALTKLLRRHLPLAILRERAPHASSPGVDGNLVTITADMRANCHHPWERDAVGGCKQRALFLISRAGKAGLFKGLSVSPDANPAWKTSDVADVLAKDAAVVQRQMAEAARELLEFHARHGSDVVNAIIDAAARLPECVEAIEGKGKEARKGLDGLNWRKEKDLAVLANMEGPS
jgi:hypothetical protein